MEHYLGEGSYNPDSQETLIGLSQSQWWHSSLLGDRHVTHLWTIRLEGKLILRVLEKFLLCRLLWGDVGKCYSPSTTTKRASAGAKLKRYLIREIKRTWKLHTSRFSLIYLKNMLNILGVCDLWLKA